MGMLDCLSNCGEFDSRQRRSRLEGKYLNLPHKQGSNGSVTHMPPLTINGRVPNDNLDTKPLDFLDC